ncbi:MAG: hypothetical protein JWM32_2614 [Verrucomicrobia bacterium]|nr:hypothetical protein [Verrucomicrobiota bacterium]
MPRVSPPSILCALLLGLAALACAETRAAGEVSGAWELVAQHLPADALARLKNSSGNADRESALAQAIVLMDSQPATDEKMRDVVSRLESLGRGDDEIALAATYMVGRVYQAHFFAADLGRAAEVYEALAARQPASYWAQLALVKLAVLKLYALPQPAGPPARVAAAEALLARVTDPILQRDLHVVIGRARLFHDLPGVLPHLVAAARVGGFAGVPRSDLQLQVAELSRREGNWAQAREFFEEFITENDADPRAYAVRIKLEEIAAVYPAAKGIAP